MRVGPYHVTRKLATGGMGELLVAVRRAAGGLERQVVIKRIRKDLAGDVRFVEMFLREAQLSVTLSHKNIVPVFDFGKVDQDLFIAMEYVRGRDLGRALRAASEAGAPLSPPVVAHIGIEVCRALDYAHGRDAPVIHRDLSPKNLLISFAGDVLVADFGLAVTTTELGQGVRGTPHYMSPEQARGEPLDPRSDLFSLGLVLREALEGRKAYAGDDPVEIIERARAAELPPLDSEVPEPLAQVIEAATRAEPERRFAGAREMLDDLDRYLVTARAAGAPPPAHELADWLGALFPEREPLGQPVGSGALDAVTFADAGIDAVARSVLARSMASLAATVGDSEIEPAPPEPVPAPPEPEPAPVRERSRGWLGLGLGLAAAVALWIALRGNRPAVAPTVATTPPAPDAALAAADAAPPPDAPIDAAAIADAAAVADAAPIKRTPPPPRPGVLVVQTDSWARVRVVGTDRGCLETPCRLTLRPGRYRVHLANPTTGAELTQKVAIEAGRTRKLIVKMPVR